MVLDIVSEGSDEPLATKNQVIVYKFTYRNVRALRLAYSGLSVVVIQYSDLVAPDVQGQGPLTKISPRRVAEMCRRRGPGPHPHTTKRNRGSEIVVQARDADTMGHCATK